MLHTLEKGEYPKGHRYWSNGYGVECYLVEWNGRYCVALRHV